ncbi:unnamed protein product, partial [marine sediment metagenome]
MPCQESDLVVTITKYWQKHLKVKHGIDSILIYPGIEPYTAKIDYSKKVFGKISRPERGKYHDEWNYIVLDLLKMHNVYYRLISNGYNKLPIVKHKKAKYIEGVRIDQKQKRTKELSRLSIYADAHGNFKETFCISLLEAMSCGLPCIIMGDQAMEEVLGDAGIKCKTIGEFHCRLVLLLGSTAHRRELGKKA